MSSTGTLRAISAWRFEYGLEELSLAYRASVDALERQSANAEQIIRKRFGLDANEPIPEPEADEEGAPIFDFWEEVGALETEANSALQIVRTAFLIGLFHFWERQSNRWIGAEKYDHVKVVQWLQEHGSTPDDNALKDLELAANCAKHGPGRSCNALYERRPDLFEENGGNSFPPFKPSDHTLRISAQTLETFFRIVRGSGPRTRRPWE